jgi:hypothetical protein
MRTSTNKIEENSGAIKIAIDMHLRSYSVVRQIGHPCGTIRKERATFDPRKRYRSYFAADTKPI